MVASATPTNTELVNVERVLTPQEERFAQFVVNGRSFSEAYLQGVSRKTRNPDVLGSLVAQRPHVKARIRALCQELWDASKMEAAEKRSQLATVARARLGEYLTPEGDIDLAKLRNAPAGLLNGLKVVRRRDADGSEIQTVEPKFSDPLRAIEIDNRMAGHDAPTVIEGQIDLRAIVATLGTTSRAAFARSVEQCSDAQDAPQRLGEGQDGGLGVCGVPGGSQGLLAGSCPVSWDDE